MGRVISAGVNLGHQLGWFGRLRARHFGKRPLIAEGGVESQATTIVNLKSRYGWRCSKLALDGLNLFDTEDADLSYFYASHLPGEPAGGVKDVQFSPLSTSRYPYRPPSGFDGKASVATDRFR